jgi:hypothetical protein
MGLPRAHRDAAALLALRLAASELSARTRGLTETERWRRRNRAARRRQRLIRLGAVAVAAGVAVVVVKALTRGGPPGPDCEPATVEPVRPVEEPVDEPVSAA